MPQPAPLPTVHMFWHGPPLSRIERLCMTSFVANGHSVHLHVYDEPSGVPTGVTLADAAAVLARQHLFAHAASGSFAIFADWFRYRLLYQQGGLWADTDVVCLKPFDYGRDEVFAWQDERVINNAVLGLPRGHELAAWMSEGCERPNRFLPYDSGRTRRRKLFRMLRPRGRGQIKWGETGPEGLTQAARHLGYAAHALPFWHFYPIHYLNWRAIFDSSLRDNPQITAASYGLHLWNERARRRPGFDKNARFSCDSLFERLCARYLTNDS
jgi:hypothetical protein